MQFKSQSQWVNLCQDVNSNLRNYNGEKAKDKSPTGSSIIKWGLRKSKFFLDFKINLVESLGSRNPIRFLKIYTSEDFDVILVVCVALFFLRALNFEMAREPKMEPKTRACVLTTWLHHIAGVTSRAVMFFISNWQLDMIRYDTNRSEEEFKTFRVVLCELEAL